MSFKQNQLLLLIIAVIVISVIGLYYWMFPYQMSGNHILQLMDSE
jgi:hypothetical protein